MNESIIQECEQYVKKLLEKGLSVDHIFHDLQHTFDVREAVLKLSAAEGISKEEIEVLELAALFHDVGYTKVYTGHEKVSQRIAETYLQERNYDAKQLQQILTCIAATKFDHQPQNVLEGIMCDADLSNLGKTDYFDKQARLRREWEIFLDERHSDKEWRKLNLEFFKEHQFYTQAARDFYETEKKNNLALMKDSKSKKEKGKGSKEKAPLASSKSAQVMFKTALRNHIDLTNLADNKANIMLSICAIIITITLPLLPESLERDASLIIPSTILLLTCLITVIFAALATRPINMKGSTPLDKVKAGKGNLFFFGNFYNMDIQDYKEGMKEVLNSEELLENSAISDLYYLGSALGTKYRLLRTCYTIFMIGMTITVLAFALVRFI